MVRESRIGYEFHPDVKQTVKDEQDGKCLVSGRSSDIEIHHLLPVCLAQGFFPTVDKEIFTQRENAVALNHEVHTELHRQMSQWPKEFVRVYTVGLYKYLRDEYNNHAT